MGIRSCRTGEAGRCCVFLFPTPKKNQIRGGARLPLTDTGVPERRGDGHFKSWSDINLCCGPADWPLFSEHRKETRREKAKLRGGRAAEKSAHPSRQASVAMAP